jgi:non-canonical (house-cleaning) NTP pyrophosphatase
MQQIFIASKSKIKLKAIKKAYNNNKNIKYINIHIESEVSTQPLNEQTLKGAKNRLNSLIQYVNENKLNNNLNDIYYSIENGIYEEDNNYYDIGCIIMTTKEAINKNDIPKSIYTDKVEVPKEYVNIALKENKTIGQIYNLYNCNLNPTDWHKSVCGKTRVQLLTEAIQKII